MLYLFPGRRATRLLTRRRPAAKIGYDDYGMICGSRLPACKALFAWHKLAQSGSDSGPSSVCPRVNTDLICRRAGGPRTTGEMWRAARRQTRRIDPAAVLDGLFLRGRWVRFVVWGRRRLGIPKLLANHHLLRRGISRSTMACGPLPVRESRTLEHPQHLHRGPPIRCDSECVKCLISKYTPDWRILRQVGQNSLPR